MNEDQPISDGLPIVITNTDWCGILTGTILGSILTGIATGMTVYLGVRWTRKNERESEERSDLHYWQITMEKLADILHGEWRDSKSVENPMHAEALRSAEEIAIGKARRQLDDSFLKVIPREETWAWAIARRFELELNLAEVGDGDVKRVLESATVLGGMGRRWMVASNKKSLEKRKFEKKRLLQEIQLVQQQVGSFLEDETNDCQDQLGK